MLYSIGYQRLSVTRLAEIVKRLNATLVDVRARPHSRRHEFDRKNLEMLMPYEWMGSELGGLGRAVKVSGIEKLDRRLRRGEELVLMCMEEMPSQCHRHHTICGPHFPQAAHIFRDNVIIAQDLTQVLAEAKAKLEAIGHTGKKPQINVPVSGDLDELFKV